MSTEHGYQRPGTVPQQYASSAPFDGRPGAGQRRPMFAFIALGIAVLGVLLTVITTIVLATAFDFMEPQSAAYYELTLVASNIAKAVLALLALALGVVSLVRRERAQLIAGIAMGLGLMQLLGVISGVLSSVLFQLSYA